MITANIPKINNQLNIIDKQLSLLITKIIKVFNKLKNIDFNKEHFKHNIANKNYKKLEKLGIPNDLIKKIINFINIHFGINQKNKKFLEKYVHKNDQLLLLE